MTHEQHELRRESTDAWRRALVTIPDESFLGLMRNYLGEIRTPFHKPHLLDKLAAWLERDETRERIVELIDEREASVLFAVDILGGSTPEILAAIFRHEIPYLEFHALLVNLEERLLVYRTVNGEASDCRLNPVLAPWLRETVLDSSCFFPSKPLGPASGKAASADGLDAYAVPTTPPWLTEGLAAAFLSFARPRLPILRGDDTLKKKVFEDLAETIPVFADEETSRRRVDLFLGALRDLGLLARSEETTSEAAVQSFPALQWNSFAALGSRQRLFLLVSAALRQALPGLDDPAGRAAFLSDLFDALPSDRLFDRASFLRLAVLIGAVRFRVAGTHSSPAVLVMDTGRLFDGLIETGWIVPVSDRYVRNPLLHPKKEAGPGRLVIQANSEISAEPSLDFPSLLAVARAAELRRHDVMSVFELTRVSLQRYLDDGGSAAELLGILEANGRLLPQNVRFSIDSWSRAYESLRLCRALVLRAEPEWRDVLERSERLSPYVREILAPGVYLLDPKRLDAFRRELERSGIPVPILLDLELPEATATGRDFSFEENLPLFSILPPGKGEEAAPSAKSRIEAIRKELEKNVTTEEFGAREKEELAERIRRKVVIFPSQLRAAGQVELAELTEARGVDYVGKVRIIEEAMRGRGIVLDIAVRLPDGSPKKYLVEPDALERRGNELVLRGHTLPNRDTVELPVKKMSRVKRIRNSLFSG